MSSHIKLLRNSENKELTDIEWMQEFYEFLLGNEPESITLRRGHKPKMSNKKAFSIIWYLQEHFPLLPDNIEKCDNCDGLYDVNCSGHYSEKEGKHYCDGCEHICMAK